MIEDVEKAIRSDLEAEWADAHIVDHRANVGFSDGKTTSHTWRIHTDDQKYELVIGPHAVRRDDPAAVVDALRDASWIERIRAEGRLLVEVDGDGLSVGPRPDGIVL